MNIDNEARCFMRLLKTLLDNDSNYLLPIKEYKNVCSSKNLLGYYDRDYVYLIPSVVIGIYPRLYGKRAVRAVCGGKSVEGMVYVMAAQKPVKLPSETYFNVILEGYSDCGIDCEALFDFMFNVQKSLDSLS